MNDDEELSMQRFRGDHPMQKENALIYGDGN